MAGLSLYQSSIFVSTHVNDIIIRFHVIYRGRRGIDMVLAGLRSFLGDTPRRKAECGTLDMFNVDFGAFLLADQIGTC